MKEEKLKKLEKRRGIYNLDNNQSISLLVTGACMWQAIRGQPRQTPRFRESVSFLSFVLPAMEDLAVGAMIPILQSHKA